MRSLRAIKLITVYFVSLLMPFSASLFAADSSYLLFVGTYTDKGSKGIYSYRFDPAKGTATPLGLAAETPNPSFLAASSDGRFLYAANEVSTLNGQPVGGVSAFAIDRKSGKLALLNQVSSLGAGPAHLALDRTGKFLLVANYDAGSVAVFPILPDGKLGPHTAFVQHTGSSVNRERQEAPHAHYIEASPDNRFVLVADLGTDKLNVYRFDAQKGTLSPADPAFVQVTPGAGPRHFAFAPSGKFVYLANELTGTVTAFAYDAQSGKLTSKQTISALPKDFHGDNTEAEIVVDAKGKFLYVSNRGDQTNDISVFSINPADGTLTFVQRIPSGGKLPRNFVLDPTGKWLLAANQASDNIQMFRIDPASGRLTAGSQISGISQPVCIVLVPEN
jgi:6-phosphogluconolactonase